MLKLPILTVLLAVATLPAFAQNAAPTPPVPYQHCLLVSSGDRYESSGVQLEYGQHAKAPVRDAQLAQDDQAVSKLGSAVAALNYMSARGWECIGVSALTTKSNAYANTTDSQTGYLLRRRAQ